MRFGYRRAWFAAAMLCLSAALGPTLAADDTYRQKGTAKLTVRDMLRFASIGDPRALDWNVDYKRPILDSPDNQFFVTIVRRGDPSSLANSGELLLFARNKLWTGLPPTVLVRASSTNSFQPLSMVHWTDDGMSLVFAKTEGNRPTQVFRLDLRSRRSIQLTHAATAMLSFSSDRRASRIVTFEETHAVSPEDQPLCIQFGCRITASSLYEAEHGTLGQAVMKVYDAGARAVELPPPSFEKYGVSSCDPMLAGGLSPDGHFGVRRCEVAKPSSNWRAYSADPDLQRSILASNPIGVRQLFLYDFNNRTLRQLIDAPLPGATFTPIWIDGGRSLLVVGAFETLVGVEGSERYRRANQREILCIDFPSGRVEKVAALDKSADRILDAQWHTTEQNLVIQTRSSDGTVMPSLAFRRSGGKWVKSAAVSTSVAQNESVFVTQGLNDRPKLVVRDNRSGRELALLDPNAWLDNYKLGHVSQISWKTPDHQVWRGILYYPPDYMRSKHYPLVIQTHGSNRILQTESGNNSEAFSLTGVANNFAAEPIAARGMMVLVVVERIGSALGTPKEWTTVQQGYESAIDKLVSMGLVDRTRVGIQGWSRSGLWTGYMLTHSSYPISAVALTATSDAGWWSYMTGEFSEEMELDYGSAPFGKGLSTWAKLSPSFNLDRVQAPVLIWSVDPVELWDWNFGLTRLHKPVEDWLISTGTHDLFAIGQRLTTGELLVDWFDFWLLGHEDADASKRAQYIRWERLCELQLANARSNTTSCKHSATR